jgi:hypothetical protein
MLVGVLIKKTPPQEDNRFYIYFAVPRSPSRQLKNMRQQQPEPATIWARSGF